MSSVYCISFWLVISALSCVESLCLIYSKWRPGLRIHTSFFLNHDCATKRTYMEIKTRILLLGILSILYGLFVTDIKYPRIDELRCYIISLNVPMLWWQKLVCTIFERQRDVWRWAILYFFTRDSELQMARKLLTSHPDWNIRIYKPTKKIVW